MSDFLTQLSDGEESASNDQLIEEVDEEKVKGLSDKDIDTRLELLDVKLQENEVILSQAKKEQEDDPMALADIQPSSDGDFMDQVLNRADKQREQDEKKKDLEGKKKLLQLEKQARKNKKHEKWVKEQNQKEEKKKEEEAIKKQKKDKNDREDRRAALMEREAMRAIIEEKNKIMHERAVHGKSPQPSLSEQHDEPTTKEEKKKKKKDSSKKGTKGKKRSSKGKKKKDIKKRPKKSGISKNKN